MKPHIKSILSNIAGLFFLSYGLAQIPEAVKTEIQNRIDLDMNPSVVVAVHDSLGDHFFSAGFKDPQKQIPASRKTFYRLGTLGNTLTGLLTARLAAAGTIRLESPLGTLVTPPLPLKDIQGRAITIGDVVSHQSGINDAKGIHISREANWDALYKEGQLARIRPYTSGNSFRYSDWAMALLASGLAEFTKTPYDRLLNQEVLKPLHLSMIYLPPGTPLDVLAAGRIPKGQHPPAIPGLAAPTLWWTANAEGLLEYGKKMLDTPEAMQETLKAVWSTRQNPGTGTYAAMGWLKDPKGNLYHAGHYDGFNTFIAIDPLNKRVITLATNTGNADITDLGLYLLDPREHPLVRYAIQPIAPDNLKAFSGTYINDAMGLELELRDRQGLLRSIQEEDTLSLHFMGNNRFLYKGLKAHLEFERNEKGEVVGVLLHKNGKEVMFIKIE